jgi:hypothetical protein
LRAAEVDKLTPTHMDVPTDQQPEVVIVGGWCRWKKPPWLLGKPARMVFFETATVI